MRGLYRSTSAVELNSEFGGDTNVTGASFSGDTAVGVSKHQTLLEVDEFVTKYDLHDIRDTMRKGALLLFHHHDLTEFEEDIPNLQGDRNSSFQIPTGLRVSFLAVWAALSIVDIQMSLYYESIRIQEDSILYRNQTESYGRTFAFRLIWSLISSILGFWLSLLMNRHWGRRQTLRLSCTVAFVTPFLMKAFQSTESLSSVITTFLSSLTSISILSTLHLYVFEITHASDRALVLSLVFICYAASNMITAALTYALNEPKAIIILSTAGITIMLPCSVLMIESPYWLIFKGSMKAAHDALCRSRNSEIESSRDLYQIYLKIKQQRSSRAKRFRLKSFATSVEMITDRRVRSIFVTCIAISFAWLFSWSPKLSWFMNTYSYSIEFLNGKSIILYGTLVVATIIRFTVDRTGRRLMIISLLCCILISNMLPHIFSSVMPCRYSPCVANQVSFYCGILSTIFSYLMLLPLLIYLSEALPLFYRDTGGCLVVAIGIGIYRAERSVVGLLNMLLKLLLNRSYLSFSILDVIIPFSLISSILLAYMYMEETTNVPLECIGETLDLSSSGLTSYRIYVHLPYMIKRYIMRRNVELEPFEESRYHRGAIILDEESMEASGDHRRSFES